VIFWLIENYPKASLVTGTEQTILINSQRDLLVGTSMEIYTVYLPIAIQQAWNSSTNTTKFEAEKVFQCCGLNDRTTEGVE
jgi:hypothetical protein